MKLAKTNKKNINPIFPKCFLPTFITKFWLGSGSEWFHSTLVLLPWSCSGVTLGEKLDWNQCRSKSLPLAEVLEGHCLIDLKEDYVLTKFPPLLLINAFLKNPPSSFLINPSWLFQNLCNFGCMKLICGYGNLLAYIFSCCYVSSSRFQHFLKIEQGS